ncbi:glutathione S-transferase family protein [Aquisalimonas asiatica]|uniref:Glutathione S-transferase n=1 Tax=Aquisalimonas asiatica TaxID=406100 RepID=A0A1H8Q604_9GAMM|nr:glutathione S-transferase [Aquisalimonas asiatica]SEO49183.1 glutathione S-transferase [Aquisalimonas asiatica]
MLKLYGFSVSNYYNVAKAALLEKGLAFEEVAAWTPLNDDFLRKSPMGKVPFLETDQGVFTEAQVILDYLEEVQPEPPLLPADPFQRAKVREISRVIELYMELPARRVYPAAFFGGQVSNETCDEARATLRKGAAALAALTGFDGYLSGDRFGQADATAVMHLPLLRDAGRKLLDVDVYETLPGVKDYLARMRERDSVKAVLADQKAGMEAFIKRKQG